MTRPVGRPRVYDRYLPQVKVLLDLNYTERSIAFRLGISKSTVHRLCERLRREKWI